MSDKFIKKNIKLSLQFDRYLSSNPSVYDKIPNRGTLVFTVKGDSYFNRQSRSMVKNAKIKNSKLVEVRKEGRQWKILALAHT